MGSQNVNDERLRLRELASQTLEAYRSLNSAAAAASFTRQRRANGDGVSRAGELLEEVVTQLKTTTNAVEG